MTEIQFTGRNIALKENQKQYYRDKIQKHERLLKKATSINIIIDNNSSHRGVGKDFHVEIAVSMPSAYIKVEEIGSNLNNIADVLDATLKRKLKRYHDQFQRWEKKQPWKAKELESQLDDLQIVPEVDSYTDYVPEIIKKEYDDETPLHPAEAIEKMELLGNKCFLFKNIENGKYCMLYKRFDGRYALVEPKIGK